MSVPAAAGSMGGEVPRSTSVPLWAGRALALLGILLVAANLRTAVAALSPIFSAISVDIPLDSLSIGVLGTLPPLCFALFGLLAPIFQRHMRIESLVLVSLLAILVGDVVRSLAGSYVVLVAGSTVVFAGMGIGNVLLPPLVKKYFPDRVGLMTSLYATVLSLFSLFPPLVAVPMSEAAGWRVSVGLWAVLTLVAVLPWIMLIVRDRRSVPEAVRADSVTAIAEAVPRGRAWHSRVAWSLGIMFGITSLNVYAMFAWLPQILVDSAGVTPAGAGALLSLYSGIGIPASLLVPLVATRVKNVGVLIWIGVALYVVGYLGLLCAPAVLPWVWVTLAGAGPLLFPLSLLLINLRTRSQAGAVALSGFVQGLGYLIGAVGPLAVGFLHQLTGGWVAPIVFLLATIAVIVVVGAIVARPHLLEDDWHRGHSAHTASRIDRIKQQRNSGVR
ncbi:CynX/NimT family MFS transporter [Subtercola vilae]|nr:MFS transporter [Subtercola vilae]